jgi:hypothetical protein
MAISSRVELRGYIDFIPPGSISLNPTPHSSADAPGKVETVTCTTGVNTFTPPAKSIGVIINYPAAIGASRILKGHTADTGIKLGITAGWIVLPLNPSSLSDIILTLASGDTLPTTLTYF